MNEQPQPIADLYQGLHQYFLDMAGKGFTTHIIKVNPDPERKLINLDVRPVAIPQEPQAWAGGVSNNGHDELLPIAKGPYAHLDDQGEDDEDDEPKEYTSGLASM